MMNNENSDYKEIDNGDVELSPTLPTIPNTSKPCVNVWMDKLSKGILSSMHFKEHWRIWVPKIYSPEPTDNCLEWNFDEDKAQKILYDPLEEFICNGNPREIIKQLSQMDNSSSICGRVFKIGEPNYSCKECGMDPTCVLCVDCFKQSAHRHHKYKMGISSGGGCCDCGDTEAWKSEPYCKFHSAASESKDTDRNKLPEDMVERAAATFSAVLKYCYDLLSMEHSPSLPADLCVKETDEEAVSLLSAPNDTYCTVLFNDETHTFEQVILTLTRIIKCSQRDGIEFVTSIDREGRAVVKCSGFLHCNELKSEIERFTTRHSNNPLKVLVEHAHVIAHQIFATKLLGWLQQFISHCEGFRLIFSDVALNAKPPETVSIVKGILMRDSQMWKAARTAWHNLFISGMLTEYESKKALAVVFTNNYGTVMKDFIRDDHDHSYSISSLSVQLFPVPTVAHHLIAHHGVFLQLLNTFMSESSRRLNDSGRLEFERNTPNTTFKRAQHILCDMRYLLSVKPDTWTDELRKGFLHGVQILLQLLSSMHWMDAVLRQVGQHMEYEQEWESAFNLHIKLAPVISSVIDWCSSDRIVLIKAFRLVMKSLHEQPSRPQENLREVANHRVQCIQYDVASEPVSIHLPLSRFFAGLFLHFEKYDLTFQSSEFKLLTRPTREEIIEHVLRTQTMISQVHAGMWRRNGYSLIHQLYFYHNVKCRAEMLDRDIVVLQAGASLIEANEFLIHILNKYNLVNWAHQNFEVYFLTNSEEDSIRQIINLVEEFLGLLITIIGERYVEGVGQVSSDDCLKKEIIQQLCIKPLSHSELNKTLSPENGVNYDSGMDRVIAEVADFKKPCSASAGKGVYELKPEFYSEYNVFFYHYTKEELSKSEEAQRKRRKAAGELECCPPPKLPQLTKTFSLLTNLLQCDVMLCIMHTVLTRTQNLKARSFSEPQVHKILHLIGYALQEQESGYYPFLSFTENASKWDIYQALESLTNSPRIDAHKDLLIWVLEKYRQVAGLSENKDEPASSAQQSSDNESAEPNKGDKNWRMKMAAIKRMKIMAQMDAMQKHFMKKNAKLFEEAELEANKSIELDSAMDLTENSQDTAVAVGKNQTSCIRSEKTYTCILCQEDQLVTTSGPAMVQAAFVQQSTVLRQDKGVSVEPTDLYLTSYLSGSPHTSTCGHVMHAKCWQKYFDLVLSKENRRPYRMRQPASFDVEKREYLCPLCECLSNTVLPLLPCLGSMQQSPYNQQDLDFDTWINILDATLDCAEKKSESCLEASHDLTCCFCKSKEMDEANVSEESGSIFSCPIQRVKEKLGTETSEILPALFSNQCPILSKSLIEMMQLYTQAAYTKALNAEPNDKDPRVPLLTWKSTAFTIHAIEFLLRDTQKPLLGSLSSRHRDSITSLVRVSAVLGATWHIINSKESSQINDTIPGYAVSLLKTILRNSSDTDCILLWDSFGILIPLIISLPNLFNTKAEIPSSLVTGGVSEAHALRLVLLSTIVKILLTSNFEENEMMEVDDRDSIDESNCDQILTLALALKVSVGKLLASELWKKVKEASTPFLRCCCLYFHFVTDVPPPVELTKSGGDTYENMCAYLGLPQTCNELLDCRALNKLATSWANHPGIADKNIMPKEPPTINKLVDLPDDYSELMNNLSMFTCPNSDREDSKNPTMCLICGVMLCSQNYCCQKELNKTMVGACTFHASECGAGVGVFLRVRDCEIIFLRSPNRGSYVCPPYLDEYGETDQGLHRGNPLSLCKDKYKKLNQTWLAHGLYEAIARAIETLSSLSVRVEGQWQHL